MWCNFFLLFEIVLIYAKLSGAVKPSTTSQVQFSPTKIRNCKSNVITGKCIQQNLKICFFKCSGCLHSVCNKKKIGKVRTL